MLFTHNIEEIIFQRHNVIQSDELIIISGYVGPSPIERLQNLPFHSRVVYGMYGSEGIKTRLHNSLVNLHNTIDNIRIYYSTLPVHSKCYVWKRRGEVVHALIGSANFSTNGLTTPYREVLAETNVDTFHSLDLYIQQVFNNSIDCREAFSTPGTQVIEASQSNICTMTLLDPKTGETHNAHGLNWGQNPNNHTNPNDANIPIRAQHIRNYPNLFPAKQEFPLLEDERGRLQRHNDSIEIIWDDNITMEGLLEGSYSIGEETYPKQISSFPEKRILGEYIRHRLNIPLDARITRRHLEIYGRTTIDVSLLNDGIYFFDFSV